jgi:hypothetical protein
MTIALCIGGIAGGRNKVIIPFRVIAAEYLKVRRIKRARIPFAFNNIHAGMSGFQRLQMAFNRRPCNADCCCGLRYFEQSAALLQEIFEQRIEAVHIPESEQTLYVAREKWAPGYMVPTVNLFRLLCSERTQNTRMNADNTLHPSAFIRVFRVIRVLHRMNLPDKIKDFGLEQIYRDMVPIQAQG